MPLCQNPLPEWLLRDSGIVPGKKGKMGKDKERYGEEVGQGASMAVFINKLLKASFFSGIIKQKRIY